MAGVPKRDQDARMLAEAISLDGGTLLVVLVVLAVLLASALAVVVAGFVWAVRGGRGSTAARWGLAGVALLELMAVLASGLVPDSPLFVASLGAILGQLTTYAWARGST